jgi:hypothetical protein
MGAILRLGYPHRWPLLDQLANSWHGASVSQHSISKLSGGRPRKTYGADRVCAHKGCTTRISSYNKNEHCWSHFQPVPRPARIPQPTAKS